MRESLERNGCLTGVLAVFIAFVVVCGMTAFIVWSPCREDWPSDGNSTTEPFSTMTNSAFLSPEEPVTSTEAFSAVSVSSAADSSNIVYSSVPKSSLTSPGLQSNDEKIKNENYVPFMAASSVLKTGAKDLEPGRSESPLRPMAPTVLSGHIAHNGRTLL